MGPKAPQTGGGEAPTERSEFFTSLRTCLMRFKSAPLALTVLLTIPLWLLLDNVVVALAAALLLACLTAMLGSLLWINIQDASDAHPLDTTPMPTDPPHTLLPCPAIPTGLPQPDVAALVHAQRVQTHLRQRIAASGGFLPFETWMQEALYAPGLGYYATSAAQFGARQGNFAKRHCTTKPATGDFTRRFTEGGCGAGDFTTAPELTPLFGRSLAVQVAQVLRDSGSLHVLEFGAGSGALAASLIAGLRDLGMDPHYHILEVSSVLRERQQARLAPLQAHVQWLDALPEHFMGCVIANEVLDAMPATLFRWDETGRLMELGVVALDDATPQIVQDGRIAPQRIFALAQRPAPQHLIDQMTPRMPPLPEYRSECNRQAEVWVRQLGAWLHTGAALLIDYGFSQREYYHPQRAEGTLMCHLRHVAHGDPLVYPGLQDITTHVDFTAMADAALASGLEILGYATQARFLMNCGIVEQLAETQAETQARAATTTEPPTAQQLAAQSAAVQTLLSEAEMGELFKVLALGRNIAAPLLGFAQGDRSHTL